MMTTRNIAVKGYHPTMTVQDAQNKITTALLKWAGVTAHPIALVARIPYR